MKFLRITGNLRGLLSGCHERVGRFTLERCRWLRDRVVHWFKAWHLELSLSRLWYTVPPMKGGMTYGQCPVHRGAGPPDRVPQFHQLDARRVSAPRPALRGRVPSAHGRVAPRWETPDRPPVYRL